MSGKLGDAPGSLPLPAAWTAAARRGTPPAGAATRTPAVAA